MSARNRCLCQSRWVIRLFGLIIQFQRGRLAIRRFFRNVGRVFGMIFAAWAGFFEWLLSLPRIVIGGLWTSLFWPVDRSAPPSKPIAALETRSENPFAPSSPTTWEQLQKLAECSMCALRKSARVSSIQVRRAGLRAQRAVQKPSPWTFASVAGSLGVLLMVIMQMSYSFESLGAKSAPDVAKEHPKTRIDPGLPQGRESDPGPLDIAQVDPFAPAEPNPFPMPSQEPGPAPRLPAADPWEIAPPLEPIPAKQNSEPRIEEEPWVDPLDRLPPYLPPDSSPDPIANVPGPPVQSAVPVEPVPSEFSPFDPPITPPTEPWTPPQKELENIPPKNEPEPWVDPLDLLPPLSPMPMEQSPPVPSVPKMPEPMPLDVPPRQEPEEFVDPLNHLPPLQLEPRELNPQPARMEPAWPPMDSVGPVELGVGFVRLPKDDEERFLRESEITLRENLARELQFDAWDRHLEQERQELLAPRPYWERISESEKERLAQELMPAATRSDYDIGPEDSRAELTVGLEKHLPPRSTAREPLRYEIVVENRGREMIDTVDVDESVPASHQLTDVSPAGHFEDNLLRWRLKELKPGEQRRLAVEVIPTQTGTVESTTSVRPTMQVGSLTNVERDADAVSRADAITPSIRLRRSGYKVVSLEESVLFTNHVQNLSSDTQKEVQIVEDVPPGFRVINVEDDGVYDRQSGTITWTVASLPPRQTIELGVILQAESQGELQSRVKGTSSDGEAVPIRARVQVEQLPAGPTQPQAPCRCPCCCCAPCRCR